MKRAAVLVALVLTSVPVFGQCPPRAEDLQRCLRELAVSLREFDKRSAHEVAVLGAINRAVDDMEQSHSLISLDLALERLTDAYDVSLADDGTPTPATRILERVTSEVKTLRMNWSEAAFAPMLERIHHESVHPLQREVLTKPQTVTNLLQQLYMLEQTLQGTLLRISGTAAGASRYGSSEP